MNNVTCQIQSMVFLKFETTARRSSLFVQVISILTLLPLGADLQKIISYANCKESVFGFFFTTRHLNFSICLFFRPLRQCRCDFDFPSLFSSG